MKKILGILGVLSLIVGFALPAQSQSNPPQNVIVKYGTLGSASDSVVVGSIGAQSTCAVTTTGTWSGTISFVVEDPQQVASPAPITGTSPDSSASGKTTTSNITQWLFPCGGSLWFKVYFSSYSSGTANVQVTASTAMVARVAGPLPPNPIFTGAIGCNAAATVSPSPSGFNGTVVCAQATALPTFQPGNIGVAGSVQVGGAITGGNANCFGFLAVCAQTLMVSNGARISSGTSSAWIAGTVPFASTTVGVSCSTVVPCKFTWSCTMSSGACTTTQTVPALSTCTITPNVTPIISATNLISSWVTLATTTLTIHVQDELGAGTTAFSGNGICL